MHTKLTAVKKAVKAAKRALIVTHVNPDGDAVGSAAGLAHIIHSLGGEARIYLPAERPAFLAWLELPCPEIRSFGELAAFGPDGTQSEEWLPDMVAFVDCGDERRSGPEIHKFCAWLEEHRKVTPLLVNIDHHASNNGFAAVNFVEPKRAATGEMIGLLAEACSIPLSGGLGMALYLALSSDTGNFTYSNTGKDTLALASRLVEAGLDVGKFTDLAENNWSLPRMHLWGRLLAEITLHREGTIAECVVPLAYLEESGLTKAELEGFASWLRKLAGVRVGLFVREDAPSLSKISLRSMGDVNVAQVAAQFGGGGHVAAAGAEIAAPANEAARMVLDALCTAMQP